MPEAMIPQWKVAGWTHPADTGKREQVAKIVWQAQRLRLGQSGAKDRLFSAVDELLRLVKEETP